MRRADVCRGEEGCAVRTKSGRVPATVIAHDTERGSLRRVVNRTIDQRLVQTQKRLEAQYGALDTKLGASNGLSNYVNQQITLWNKG